MSANTYDALRSVREKFPRTGLFLGVVTSVVSIVVLFPHYLDAIMLAMSWLGGLVFGEKGIWISSSQARFEIIQNPMMIIAFFIPTGLMYLFVGFRRAERLDTDDKVRRRKIEASKPKVIVKTDSSAWYDGYFWGSWRR